MLDKTKVTKAGPSSTRVCDSFEPISQSYQTPGEAIRAGELQVFPKVWQFDTTQPNKTNEVT